MTTLIQKRRPISLVPSAPVMTLMIDGIRFIENEGNFSKAEDRKFDYVPIIDAGTVMKGSRLVFSIDGFRQPDEIIVKMQSKARAVELEKIDQFTFAIGNNFQTDKLYSMTVLAKWLDKKQVPTHYGNYFYHVRIIDRS